MAGKDVGPVLVANPQGIAKALGDQQQGAIALPLQQSIGRYGRPHLHHLNGRGGNRLIRPQPQQIANALDRGIGVAIGVFRQELMDHNLPIRATGHNVGKGAAAINPKLPLRRAAIGGLKR